MNKKKAIIITFQNKVGNHDIHAPPRPPPPAQKKTHTHTHVAIQV